MSTQAVVYADRNVYALDDARPRVGRLSRESITVCGFQSSEDAFTAASVAFHGLRQHLAERFGRSVEQLPEAVHTTAVDVRANDDDGAPSFCFELRFPLRLTAAKAIRAAQAIDDALHRFNHMNASRG